MWGGPLPYGSRRFEAPRRRKVTNSSVGVVKAIRINELRAVEADSKLLERKNPCQRFAPQHPQCASLRPCQAFIQASQSDHWTQLIEVRNALDRASKSKSTTTIAYSLFSFRPRKEFRYAPGLRCHSNKLEKGLAHKIGCSSGEDEMMTQARQPRRKKRHGRRVR